MSCIGHWWTWSWCFAWPCGLPSCRPEPCSYRRYERVPVLRIHGDRPPVDGWRDDRAAECVLARHDNAIRFRQPLRVGYAPACANEWRAGICEKPRIKCSDCGHRSLIALTDRTCACGTAQRRRRLVCTAQMGRAGAFRCSGLLTGTDSLRSSSARTSWLDAAVAE
ncbi:TOTE conflict system archaeo-eukaryotic primase domain-containing protein [Piscinibacter sp.]|uniref:TOTE conflict system archaeo-eukaryotic primase domain-containing protein n=1 Tax=Piscinibacter sp. TaxID=1903157 RepID=UPI00355A017F